MDSKSYKTISANNEIVKKEWLLIDAENQTLGRFASRIAKIIRGKHKTYFTPHFDCGDNVVVINAEKIKVTGKKAIQKSYVRHTGYPGGQRFASYSELISKKPERVIELAVKRMLPGNKLSNAQYKNLYVYAGTQHPHEAQKPKQINFNNIK